MKRDRRRAKATGLWMRSVQETIGHNRSVPVFETRSHSSYRLPDISEIDRCKSSANPLWTFCKTNMTLRFLGQNEVGRKPNAFSAQA